MEAIIINVVSGLVLALALLVIGWVAGPLKWLKNNRELRRLISNGRQFHFVYDTETNDYKVLSFNQDGSIGEGNNNQESTWRIRRGALEIMAYDGQLYSRFRRNPKDGILYRTNDLELRSKHGQLMKPKLVKLSAK